MKDGFPCDRYTKKRGPWSPVYVFPLGRCSEFNVHHREWLVYFNQTDEEGRYRIDFYIAYELTQLIEETTRVPDVTGQ